MDASSLQTLASHWLCHSTKVGQTRCQSDKDYVCADCWTDHRLVVSKLNLRIQPARRPQGKKVPKKLDVSKQKQDSKRQAFINDICSRLDAMEKKGKWKVQGVPQSQTAALPRPQEEEETDKSKQAQIEQTYEKH